MRMTNRMAEVGSWMLETWHRTTLTLTGGRYPHTLNGMRTLELFTIGRKSGERRGTMLTAPICEPDRIVVIASKGGHQVHPAWYLNLTANPDVEIVLHDGTTLPMRARTATGQEREELWARAVEANKGYAGYQANAEREIPVVVCEPY
jgi:deazaflavin-dependent oxidoreductase (nitroreductase family)